MGKGLDPEAFSGKYPPPIRMYSKYERRTDTRTYDDRKKLYEGGWEVIRANPLMPSGKRSMKNGARDQQRGYPSGLVKDLARKQEIPRPLRGKKMVAVKPHQLKKRKKKKRRRKKRKNKQNFFLTWTEALRRCFNSLSSYTQ